MISYIFNASSSICINTTVPYVLFGIYYGLLTTLPLGSSQILCVRAFVTGGILNGIVALSGSMIGQLLLILSIYYSPLYIFFLKPHLMTVVVIPYMFLFWFRIKELANYQDLRPATSLRDPRMIGLFLNSFFFQIINPILLPSPVLARLIHLFFFRWSNNAIFLISSFFGWLIGHVIFSYLSGLLIARIEKDSPIVYLLVKRAIHATFSIIVAVNFISYLGRAPGSFWTRKFSDESIDKDLEFWNVEKTKIMWWLFKPWPASFFDPSRANRPIRYKKNSRFDNSSPVKKKVSNYYFGKCLTDGKQRLCFAALPSSSILEEQLEESLEKENLGVYVQGNTPHQNWIFEKLARAEALQKELKDRIGLLEVGSTFCKAMEKGIRLAVETDKTTRIPNIYDPFLAKNYRIRKPIPQTFLTMDELDFTSRQKNKSLSRIGPKLTVQSGSVDTNKRIECWVSNKKQELGDMDRIALPWEGLPKKTQRVFHFMFNHQDLPGSKIPDIVKEIETSSKTDITWENIFEINPTERALFFTYLQENTHRSNKIYLSDLLSVSGERKVPNPRCGVCSTHEIEDLERVLVHETETIFDSDYDLPGLQSDVRYRKLRNIGFNANRKKSTVVKRFAKVPDFRRRIIKGSLRSRRRKIPVLRMLENKAHSPFFLRLTEVPTNMPKRGGGFKNSNYEEAFIDSEGTIDPGREQILIFVSGKKRLSQSKKIQTGRSTLAARMDIGTIHSGRGLLLILQSNLRKYVKLPVAIVFKNLVRSLLRQDAKWDIDWMEWKRETHIYCTYDGEEYSQIRLPGRWLKEGLQIKILYPFEWKPWHNHGKKKRSSFLLGGQKRSQDRALRKVGDSTRKRSRFTYLTAWGFQTDVPFGTIQKQPSFWKPIRKELIRIWRKKVLLRIRQLQRLFTKLDLLMMPKPKGILSARQTEIIGKDTSIFQRQELIEPESSVSKLGKDSFRTSDQLRSINDIDGEQLSDGFVHGTMDPLTRRFVKSEWIAKTFQDESVIDERARDTSFDIPLEIGREIAGFGGIDLRLRLSIAEYFERSLWIVSTFWRITKRTLANYFNEFVSLKRQLLRAKSEAVEVLGGTVFSGSSVPGTEKWVSWPNQMKPLSQAYIYESLWNTSINGNTDFRILLNNSIGNLACTAKTKTEKNTDQKRNTNVSESVLNLDYGDNFEVTPTEISFISDLISESFRESKEEWGLSKQLSALDLNNWNNWMDSFHRYNLPLKLWRSLAPKKWKVYLSNSDTFDNNETGILSKKNKKYSKQKSYSIYAKNSLLKDRINNSNKRLKYSYLLQNLTGFIRDADTRELELPFKKESLARKSQLKFCRNELDQLGYRNFISKQKHFKSERKRSSKIDLNLWIVPDIDFAIRKKKFIERLESKFIFSNNDDTNNLPLKKSELEGGFPDTLNETDKITLDERESLDLIYRWKWKSKALEGKLEELKNLTVLIDVLGNNKDLAAFCSNTNIDLELLSLFLDATKFDISENLSLISAHRLPSISDDQILMYRAVNLILKSKYRVMNISNRRLSNNIEDSTYISRLFPVTTEILEEQFHFYNIEDLLLPRRRRELRFLQSLINIETSELKTPNLGLTPRVQQFCESNGFGPNDVPRIKRFLWPSYRLEELACMGRFSLNISNGSRFTALKLRMYPTF